MDVRAEASPQIYDISPLISSQLAVFPGDVSFQRNVSMDFTQGDHLSLSSINSTVHLGAHADAPSHYHPEGRSIDQMPIDIYLGSCQVVDVSRVQGEITLKAFEGIEIRAPRLLFKTNSIVDVNQWQVDFSYLHPDVIAWLAERNVRLVGIDTPSMDHSTSKALTSHQSFFRHQIAILEGLVLTDVPEGIYKLIALPLKIAGGEASPIRAILLKGDLK